ncbi:MAG TPA: Zn-binding domain-containing protein, partial [Armatimonadota bacterium]|nr:Zn-binding domain-containing protein [Armatimonadota bacterium]
AELPMTASDCREFGETTPAVMEILDEEGHVYERDGRWYWKGESYPARNVNLRNIDENNYLIQDVTGEKPKVIGQLDELSAFTQVHPQAIYMHRAETYFVDDLNLTEKIAYVRRGDYDYYTQAIDKTEIQIEETEIDEKWRVSDACFGPVVVTTTVHMFRKIKFYSRDSVGFGNLDLPPLPLNTDAVWTIPPRHALERVRSYGRIPEDGLLGIANAAIGVLPLWVMCDPADVGSAVDSSNTGSPAIFIYDRYPGGLGFAQKAQELVEDLFASALYLIQECECDEGCPSCVGSPLPVYGPPSGDLDSRGKIPDKEAALCLLHDMLEKEAYEPKPLDPKKLQQRLKAAGYVAPAPGDEAPAEEPLPRPVAKKLPANVEKRLRRRIGKFKR